MHIPHPWSKGDPTCAQKDSLGVRRQACQAIISLASFFPDASVLKSTLAEGCVHTAGRVLRQISQGVQNKAEESRPLKSDLNFPTAGLCTRLSLSSPLSLSTCNSTFPIVCFIFSSEFSCQGRQGLGMQGLAAGLCGLAVGNPGLHSGDQGSVPSQGTKVLLPASAHCCCLPQATTHGCVCPKPCRALEFRLWPPERWGN